MQYTKKLLLKNNKECLLRNAVGADAEEIHNLFNLTHAQTDFLCTYPDENLFDISQEQKILSEKISSENEIEICAVVNGHIVGTAGMSPAAKEKKLFCRKRILCSIQRKKVKQYGIKTLNFGIVQWGMNQMIFTEKLSVPK